MCGTGSSNPPSKTIFQVCKLSVPGGQHPLEAQLRPSAPKARWLSDLAITLLARPLPRRIRRRSSWIGLPASMTPSTLAGVIWRPAALRPLRARQHRGGAVGARSQQHAGARGHPSGAVAHPAANRLGHRPGAAGPLGPAPFGDARNVDPRRFWRSAFTAARSTRPAVIIAGGAVPLQCRVEAPAVLVPRSDHAGG